MIKLFVYAFAISIFLYGAYETYLSFQFGPKPNTWKTTDGWLTEEQEGFNLPTKKGEKLNALLDQPSIAYAYKVDGLLYYEREELPACLAPVRNFLDGSKENSAGSQSEDPIAAALEDNNVENLLGKYARFNPDTRKMEIMTDPGMIISSNYATNQLNAKWEELPEERWGEYLRPIKVKYNPSNPHESVTDPDLLKGGPTLLMSGIIFMVIPLLVLIGWTIHENLTKPEEIPDPFKNSRRL